MSFGIYEALLHVRAWCQLAPTATNQVLFTSKESTISCDYCCL